MVLGQQLRPGLHAQQNRPRQYRMNGRCSRPVAARPAVPANGTPSVLPKVIDHLKHVRQVLIKIQGQVQKDIKAVEEALDGWK